MEANTLEIKHLNATIVVTEKCNMACSYCYEKDKSFEDNTKENIFRFLTYLRSSEEHSKKYDTFSLDFIGGEPLMAIDLIDYAIETFEALFKDHKWGRCNNHYYSMSTNGTLLGDSKVRAFLNKHPRLMVGLSLDGDKEMHDKCRKFIDGEGSYDTVLRNLEWWKDKYKQNFVKGTFGKETLPFLSKGLKAQIDMGFQMWINPSFDDDWTEEDGKIYYKELCRAYEYCTQKANPFFTQVPYKVSFDADKDTPRCGTGRYMVALGVDGKLYPCNRFASDRKWAIGNCKDGVDFNELAKFMNYVMFRVKNTPEACYASDVKPGYQYMLDAQREARKYWFKLLKEWSVKNAFISG